MNSKRVKEIKKGLRCMAGEIPCDLCFYHERAEHQEMNCINLVAEDSLDLINELEKEKKEYGKKKFLRGWKLGIEEFAERLIEKYGKSCSEYYPLLLELTSEQLDETLKEFINE